MIVNLQDEGWEIIYHRAHALLAAQIAGQWNQKDSPQRLVETIAAISDHDDLEKEWEGDELTAAGAPMDFTLNKETPINKLQKLVEGALYRSRWVAMLTSMHVCFLNQGKQGSSKELDNFLNEQRKLQKQWQKELNISKEEAESAYRFMEWCDRLSLILCQGQLPVDERALEITTGPDGKRHDVIQLNNGFVTVTPWPFANEKFMVRVEASSLSQIKFEDNKALTEALKNAPRKTLEWTFVKL